LWQLQRVLFRYVEAVGRTQVSREQFQEIKQRINRELSQSEGIAFSFSPPAIPGLAVCGDLRFARGTGPAGTLQFLATNLQTFLAQHESGLKLRA